MKKTKLILACTGVALVAALASCGGVEDPDGYTYRDYTSALASNWNPHTWETNADDAILSYLSEGLVSLQPKDTAKGVYQWAYDMAESVEDVTFNESGKAALKKYHGFTDESIAAYEESCGGEPGQVVYQIKLREGLQFQDGTAINAQSFVDSGKLLLDPSMKNYRANLYIAGESAVVGGFGYYYQGSEGYFDASTLGTFSPEIYEKLVFCIDSTKLGGFEVFTKSIIGQYADEYECTSGTEFLSLYLGVPDEDIEKIKTLEGKTMTEIAGSTELTEAFNIAVACWCTEPNEELHFFVYKDKIAAQEWEQTVGLYKVDDLTFNYVMNSPLDRSQAMVSFMSTWLVHPEMYNSNKDTSGALVTTKYGTALANTMSYGPYKLQSLEASKQMVLVKNENWHGYTKDEKGKLVSYTNFEVDGVKVQQYQTTKLVIDVLDDAAAKQKFLAGELSNYTPTSSELSEYTLSDALYKVEENYVMSFFFNTDLEALKEMDKSKGNTNSVVLSNVNLRKAMSLAIDRAEFVTATPAYQPAFALFNDLNYYDVWNNPESSYRKSEAGMQALCNLYGVEYGPGKAYHTIEEAVASITGFNLSEAKALMKQAHDELVAAGVYTGGDVKIKVGYTKGPLQSDEQAQLALLNKYMAAAIEGSGFTSFVLEGVGNIEDRYGDVPKGEYAIGYGAWGGAAFYPYRGMQVYCDPDQYNVNELGCWDPTTETLTIEFDYKEGAETEHFGPVTHTWQWWSQNLQSGYYANLSAEAKLKILATMEEEYLDMCYRIPLCGTCSAFLLGYQVSYITEKYNIMYDFGGFRLMKYNYTNAQWADYVKKNGGKIDYK